MAKVVAFVSYLWPPLSRIFNPYGFKPVIAGLPGSRHSFCQIYTASVSSEQALRYHVFKTVVVFVRYIRPPEAVSSERALRYHVFKLDYFKPVVVFVRNKRPPILGRPLP